MEGNNPLYKEILNPVGNEQKKPLINEEKNKINRKQKVIPKKKKVSKQNININITDVDDPKISEDDLEHPAPLLSDCCEEEEKEEIKNDFYKNKLKEKEKMMKNNENSPQTNSNILPQKLNKINNKNNNKMRVLDNGIDFISNKNENNKDDYLQISIKIKNKDIDEGESKGKKIINKGNNSIKKINQKNNIKNEQNQDKIPIKNNQKRLNKIPLIKNLKIKKFSHKIIKKSTNLNPSSKRLENADKKELIHPNKKVMKIKSNNNLIHKNSFSNTLENEHLQNNTKRIDDINPNFIQKEAKSFQNNNYYIYQIKKKIIPNKLAKKSQSYSNISLNNICSNNSKINYYHNIVSKEREQKMLDENNNKEEQLNNLISPIKVTHHSNINLNKKMTKKISIPLDFAKYQNISNTYRKEPSTHYNNNQSINNTVKVKVNSIHNNNNFFSQISEQKENVQDNSQYKKHTYQNGGKFNNIQTTYVVISKNSNSNVKLIPNNFGAVEYENNRYLNTIQSDFLLKTSRFFSPQKNNPILNTEKKVCRNQNCYQYYSSYNNFPKTPNNNIIKTHESYNNINIKRNYNNYYYQKTDDCNLGMNYMNNLDNSIEPSKSQTVANQYRNNNYLIDQSGGNRGRRIDKFENYYDYCGEGRISTESYLSSSTTNKYAY